MYKEKIVTREDPKFQKLFECVCVGICMALERIMRTYVRDIHVCSFFDFNNYFCLVRFKRFDHFRGNRYTVYSNPQLYLHMLHVRKNLLGIS